MARRRAEKSVATIGSMPFDFSAAITASPTGPQPSTSAPSPGLIPDLLTACSPTVMGSVSAARRASSPFGTLRHMPAVRRMRSAYAPL